MSTPALYNYSSELENLASFNQEAQKMSEDELLKATLDNLGSLATMQNYFCQAVQRSAILVLKIGYALLQLKKKYKREGAWVKFFETHLPNLKKSTIYRYMKLAEAFPDPTRLPQALSITDAYRLAGIEPAKPPAKPALTSGKNSANEDGKTSFVFNVMGFQEHVGAFKEMAAMLKNVESSKKLSGQDRQTLLEELQKLSLILREMRICLIPPLPQSRPPAKPEA
jgi:hypothetical protein